MCPRSSSSREACSQAATHTGSTVTPSAAGRAYRPMRSRPGGALGVREERLARRERRRPVRVALLGPRQRVEQRRRVAHAARQRTLYGKAVDLDAGGPRADPAPRRLDAEQAADARRDPDGAAPVAGVGDRHEAERHCHRRPAAGSSGGQGRVPRVAGRTRHIVVGVATAAEFGGVGLAEADRACLAEPGHAVGVGVRHMAAKALDPYVVRTPAVSTRSFTAVGTPNSGGRSPSARRSCAAAAPARAASDVTVRKAPNRSS